MILIMIAGKAIREARRTWRLAQARSDVATLDSAFIAATFAARAMHQAAQASDHDAGVMERLTTKAKALDVAADKLRDRLVRATLAG